MWPSLASENFRLRQGKPLLVPLLTKNMLSLLTWWTEELHTGTLHVFRTDMHDSSRRLALFIAI